MSSRIIYPSQSSAVRSASVADSYRVRGNVVSIGESSKFMPPAGLDPSEIHRDSLACARGVRTAFILEAGMALVGCAVWLLWHFVR